MKPVGVRVVTVIMVVGSFAGCDMFNKIFNVDQEDSVTTELFKEIEVTLSGSVTAVDTGEGIADATVAVMEYETGSSDGEELQSTTTAADGEFAIDDAVTLDIDTKEYRLAVSGPGDSYYTNDATLIYALRDGALDTFEVQLVPKNPISTTLVQGVVRDGLSRTTGLEGVTVTLTDVFDATAIYSTTTTTDNPDTDANELGTFSVEVPVSRYTVTYDASTADTLSREYIVEYNEEILENTAVNDIGTQFIVPEIPDGEYRVVLQWQNTETSQYDLATFLDVFTADMPIVNTIGPEAGDVEIQSRYSLNPGTGFAKETAYWPSSVIPSGDRQFVNSEEALTVGGETVIEIDRDDASTVPIEVITFHQESPLSAYPANLTYYYPFSDGSRTERHYPVGVYNMVVFMNEEWSDAGTNIYDSNASIKLYAGDEFLGSFDIGTFEPSIGESNTISWNVLFIEVGFTTPNPTEPADMYLRSVPYFSVWPENELWGQPPFFTQTRYDDDGTAAGTDDFGEITSLMYDSDWGLFAGTGGNGIRAINFSGSEADEFDRFAITDPVIDVVFFESEGLALVDTDGSSTNDSVTGELKVLWDSTEAVFPGAIGDAPPTDINAIASNPKADDSILFVGAEDGIYTLRWDTGSSAFRWKKATGPSGPCTFIEPGVRRELVGFFVDDGNVYSYDQYNDAFIKHTELAPPTGAGTLVMGGTYGYIDGLDPGTELFWGVTRRSTGDPVVYVNTVRVTLTEDTGPPVTFTLGYEYGTSTVVDAVPVDKINDIGILARPGESYSGQPVFGTTAGLYEVRYNGNPYASGSTAASYFTIETHPFLPTDINVQAIASTYETTFLGTKRNGILHTLGGVF